MNTGRRIVYKVLSRNESLVPAHFRPVSTVFIAQVSLERQLPPSHQWTPKSARKQSAFGFGKDNSSFESSIDLLLNANYTDQTGR